MDQFLWGVLESLLLVAALSMDAFVASFAYGSNQIKIPFRSAMRIDLVCSAMLGASLLMGALIGELVPSGLVKGICFSLLFFLGVVKLFDSSIKGYIRRKQPVEKELSFTMLHLNFILTVYADPKEADRDCSRELSPAEATSLAAALSLDGLAVGFGAALTSANCWEILGLSLLWGYMAVRLGERLAQKTTLDLSWLSGVLLMLLAFLKL